MPRSEPSRFANPIFCAVDRPDRAGALDLAREVQGSVGGLKLGLEFVTANGPEGVRAMRALGLPIFLDLKLHDIPNTVAGAVREAVKLDIAMLTLHASGGEAMLRAAVEAAAGAAQRPWLLGVTVLTSLDDADLRLIGVASGAVDQAVRLAELALRAGLDGVVCSPFEIEPIRRAVGPELKLVVPGIRPLGATGGDDQKRAMGAARALALGAVVLVIGRPITRAASPGDAASGFARELAEAA
jgi:orotidine-5'-phosphate decarboxylase